MLKSSPDSSRNRIVAVYQRNASAKERLEVQLDSCCSFVTVGGIQNRGGRGCVTRRGLWTLHPSPLQLQEVAAQSSGAPRRRHLCAKSVEAPPYSLGSASAVRRKRIRAMSKVRGNLHARKAFTRI